MKKIVSILLSLSLVAVFVNVPTMKAQAQAETKRIISTDTTVNADTSYVAFEVPGNLTSIHIDIKRTSGAVGGKIYLWRSNNNSTWELADSSAALTDQATNTKIFTYKLNEGFPANFARAEYRTSATGGAVIRLWYTKWPPQKPQ